VDQHHRLASADVDVANLYASGREEVVLERRLRVTAEHESDDQRDREQK